MVTHGLVAAYGTSRVEILHVGVPEGRHHGCEERRGSQEVLVDRIRCPGPVVFDGERGTPALQLKEAPPLRKLWGGGG